MQPDHGARWRSKIDITCIRSGHQGVAGQDIGDTHIGKYISVELDNIVAAARCREIKDVSVDEALTEEKSIGAGFGIKAAGSILDHQGLRDQTLCISSNGIN